MQLQLELFVK